MSIPIQQIRALVGPIDEEPFSYIDYALTDDLALFSPQTGQCPVATTPEHTHPAYSFIVAFDDFCRVKTDGKILQSRAGTFCGFSPGVPHQELPADAPPRYVAILIARDYFEKRFVAYQPLPVPKLRCESFLASRSLLASLREFMVEYEEKTTGYKELLAASGLKITHLIIRQILSVAANNQKVDYRMATNDAVEFMHTHLEDKLTITDLARTVHLSPSHFARVFKEEMGQAPIEYLQELRLQRSKRMLRDTDATITEIAMRCGFNSTSYLSRCFAARFMMTPSNFRKFLGVRDY